MKTNGPLVTAMIDKWARKKFKDLQLSAKSLKAIEAADHFTIEQETRGEGYCPTCYSEYTVIAVYAVDSKGNETLIYDDSNASLMELMEEILGASQE